MNRYHLYYLEYKMCRILLLIVKGATFQEIFI